MRTLEITPHRILILQTAFPGDVILTIPLLQATKSLFPDAKIDFLVIPAAKNILETHPDIFRLIIYDKHKKDRGMANFWKLTKDLRKHHYDLALVPHRSMRSASLVWGAGIPRRIGFDRSAGRFLFTNIIPYPQGVHEINRNLHLLTPLEVDVTKKVFPRLYFTDEDRDAVHNWMGNESLSSSDRIITIAPGSVWATKRWLAEYFAQTAAKLTAEGFKIVLIGGETDKAVAAQLEEFTEVNICSAVGKFTLRQSALLIKHSELLITNDSAPMHLSVAVGTPVAAIFGPTVPAFGFYPYGESDRVAELKNLACRPCGKHGGDRCPIGTFECMRQLTPDRVLKEAQSILNLKIINHRDRG
jgi:heptosyltransferase-2